MKILIADDESHNRILMEELLASYGELEVVSNGLEAVELYQSALANGAPFDLICLDMMMPIMDGQEALQQIRAIEKKLGINAHDEVKILMVTAIDIAQEIYIALQSGCTDYIIKPISKKKLEEKLKEYKLIH